MGSETALSGRLHGVSIPELLWQLHRAGHTGSLLLERDGVRKAIYFREGRVVFGASTDPEDRLGAYLFRRGEVDLAPLLEAGGDVARGRRLGQILIERGLMAAPALLKAVAGQVREIVLSVFGWRDGLWRISRAALPSEESVTLDMPVEELLLAGVRRVPDGGRVRRAVGGPGAVHRAAPGALDLAPGVGLTERAILAELQTPRRVDQLCLTVVAPSEVVVRVLWALRIMGLVEPAPARSAAQPPEGGADCRGLLEEREGAAADLLLTLGDRRYTGVVRLSGAREEGAIFFREGTIEFAITSDPELSLGAFLLRRGVISDKDRDEAARWLITGKRLGALLAEHGALNLEDVKRFVREQVLEIVARLALWTAGEYVLEENETIAEPIVLGMTAEDVIMSAYESLADCERIWRELGGLATRRRLRPEYLQRLDRMTLRPAVWELVSLLRAERALEELLSLRPESDFEICRWLCGLSRVRVVERVPLQELLSREEAAPTAPWTAFQLAPAAPPTESAAAAWSGAKATARDLAPELFETPGVAPTTTTAWDSAQSEPTTPAEAPSQGAPMLGAASESEPHVGGGESRTALAIEPVAAPTAGADAESESADEPPAEEVAGSGVRSPSPGEALHDGFETRDAGAAADLGVGAAPWAPAPSEVSELSPSAETQAAGDAGPVYAPPAVLVAVPWATGGALGGPALQPCAAESFLAPQATSDQPLAAAAVEDVTTPAPSSAPPSAFEAMPPSGADSGPGATVVGSQQGDEPTVVSPAAEAPASAPVDESGLGPTLDPNRTVAMPRPDLTEAASLGQEGVGKEVAGPSTAPLASPGPLVDRFNRRHQVLFHALRREIGAGARNFVLTCQRRLGAKAAAFDGVAMEKTGVFDRESLVRALAERWPERPSEPLDELIDIELSLVRGLLSTSRVSALEEALAVD